MTTTIKILLIIIMALWGSTIHALYKLMDISDYQEKEMKEYEKVIIQNAIIIKALQGGSKDVSTSIKKK